MANIRVELNSAAVQELLKSPEIASVCEAEAEKMTRMTGMPYVADVHVGKTRVNARGIGNKATLQSASTDSGKTVSGFSGKSGRTITVKGHWTTTTTGKRVYVKAHKRKIGGNS